MGNSISNEECNKACDVKINKEKQSCDVKINTEKQSLDNNFENLLENRLIENSEKLFKYIFEVYENPTTKDEFIRRMDLDKEIYLDYIKGRILSGHIIVPENETPTDDDKIKYFNAISEATNIKIEGIKKNINESFNNGVSEDRKKAMRNEWNKVMEKIIPIILTGEFTDDKETISKFFAQLLYHLDKKISLRDRYFNKFKGFTYNPPNDPTDASIESFVNNVDEEDNEYEYYNESDIKNDNIFLKILFILIIIALLLHLFRD